MGLFILVQRKRIECKRKRAYLVKAFELEEEENGRDKSDEGETYENRTKYSL